ncbi:MAG: hypothetical protein HQ518_25250 [Rhodopirellula sp.]|nr:hypothetical protein [Rhodopirellula sp.]
MSKSVPGHHRDVARVAAEAFGGTTWIRQCWDNAGQLWSGVLVAFDKAAKFFGGIAGTPLRRRCCGCHRQLVFGVRLWA